jgi:hypothetical protein
MASTESMELSEGSPHTRTMSMVGTDLPRNEQTLPPVDRGSGAWSFVSVFVLAHELSADNTLVGRGVPRGSVSVGYAHDFRRLIFRPIFCHMF